MLAARAEELTTAPLFVRALWHGPTQTGTIEVRRHEIALIPFDPFWSPFGPFRFPLIPADPF